MNTETGWIAMTTRKPTEEDLPVWVVNSRGYGKGPVVEIWRDTLLSSGEFKYLSHWMLAKMPMPPPLEPTQRDLDESATHQEWLRESAAGDTDKRGWHEKGALWAFRTERAAILALTYQRGHPGMSCSAAMDRIQERCEGTK